jgi:DNA-binding NarL/FixJ family response regulator
LRLLPRRIRRYSVRCSIGVAASTSRRVRRREPPQPVTGVSAGGCSKPQRSKPPAIALKASAAYARCGATYEATRLAGGQTRKLKRAPFGARLTERELEIARLVARNRSNGDIARALEISVRTVHHHVEAAFNKLGIYTRTQLTEDVVQAYER